MEERKADVYLEESVIDSINCMIYRNPGRECGGFLIGNIARDPVTGACLVQVRELYEEKERTGTSSSFTFTPDYVMNAVRYVKKNCPESRIIGNIHSHGRFEAFWSGVDRQMMRQAREDSLYLVVSPRYGTWEALFKDQEFRFYSCEVHRAGRDGCDHMFRKAVTRKDRQYVAGGRKVKETTFRTQTYYTEKQKAELDKRFLHSIQDLKGKRVLIVGAGTIGNLLVEYLIHSGVGELTIVDKDQYEYWNLPRSSMIDETALEKPKALELAKAAARRSCFPLGVRGIHGDICSLGWGFFRNYDLVLSPVDSAAVRQYIDRGCRLYHVPHITCGTGVLGNDFTGNVLYFPEDSVVDLEYVWGTGYRKNLEEKLGCSDVKPETQAQLMGFSAQIAGMTMDLALRILLGRQEGMEKENPGSAWKYVLNSIGNGFPRDQGALRTFRYGRHPNRADSELYGALAEAGEIRRMSFDRTRPKHELWEKLNELFQEDIPSYRLNLEWSLNLPVAYDRSSACRRIEVAAGSGVDPVLTRLPREHIYLAEGEEKNYLLKLCFTEKQEKERS